MSETTKVEKRENGAITTQKENTPKENLRKCNKAFVIGKIEAELAYSHEVYGEKFYRTRVVVKRKSGTEDFVPIMLSERLIRREMRNTSLQGKWVAIEGQFRSNNKWSKDGKSHLELFLFVMSINIYEEGKEPEEIADENAIYLDGYLCKSPVFRKTPLGREITELFIAVNRPYGKSDYIPCITWGRTARWASQLQVGDRVTSEGRIQSKKRYYKTYSPDSEEGEFKDAYEISIATIQKAEC